MSSHPPFTDEFKKNLRSLLLSEAGGVELSKVEQNYKKFVGEPLRYREYGFQNVHSLLEALPDVARYVISCLLMGSLIVCISCPAMRCHPASVTLKCHSFQCWQQSQIIENIIELIQSLSHLISDRVHIVA